MENFFTRKRVIGLFWAGLTVAVTTGTKAVLSIAGISTAKIIDFIFIGIAVIGVLTFITLLIVWKIQDKFKELEDKINQVNDNIPSRIELMNTMDYKDTTLKNEILRRADGITGGFNDRFSGVDERIDDAFKKINNNSFTKRDRLEFETVKVTMKYRAERYLALHHGMPIWVENKNYTMNAIDEFNLERSHVKDTLGKIFGNTITVAEIENYINSLYIEQQ